MEMKSGLINQVNKIKPLLKKTVPPGILRRGKSLIVKRVQRQMKTDKKLPFESGAFPFGVNLIGPADAATGLGQSFRLVIRAVEETGIPNMIYPFAATAYHRTDIGEYRNKISDTLTYAVNLWHVSPLEFTELYARMGKEAFDRHYNIAYWLWELEDFPDEWVGYEAVLDEIWTPSEFISRGLRKKVHIPVYTVPYWVSAETDTARYDRKWFGLPDDRFLFLMMYDGKSVSERKNPDGVIKAYRKAFGNSAKKAAGSAENGREAEDPACRVGLVIKAGSLSKREKARLASKLAGCPDTCIITGSFGKKEVNSLIACCDTLVSLHRAEGFGLVMAESMLCGVPVIATDWSANTEFMNRRVACMVPCQMVRLRKNIPPYRKGSCWAEPDTDTAARWMRRLASDENFRTEKAGRARDYAEDILGRDRTVRMMDARLQAVLLQ